MDQNKVNLRKVAVIGCGFVGSSSAFALMQSGLFSEMVLLDVNRDRAEGEALDIVHGVPLTKPMKIYAGDYDDIVDAAIIVITAGANQKPGETRLDLVKRNVAIFKTIIPEIANRNSRGMLLVVSNPVDIMTYVTLKISGFPKSRVIGSGTVLDTSRLKHLLGEHLGVDHRSVHAFIIGEHGDSEIAAFSSANVSGIPVHEFCELRGFYHHEKATKEFAEKCKRLKSRGVSLCVGAVGIPEMAEQLLALRNLLPDDIYLWINKMNGLKREYTHKEQEKFLAIDPYFWRELEVVPADRKQCEGRLFVEADGSMRICNISRKTRMNWYDSYDSYDSYERILKEAECGQRICSCYLA